MRYFIPLLLLIFTACDFQGNNPKRNEEYKDKIDGILGKFDLNGTILVFDAKRNLYYSNNIDLAEQGRLPASTFKIVNSIIALETNVLKDENVILKWDGQKRAFESWEKDMTVREAFQASCLPCYQEVAKHIGVKRMKAYLNKLHYSNMDVNEGNIDNFWIKGKSHISPFEQIDFLERFYTKKLPILHSTYDKMIRIFEKENTESYRYFGKTGWSDDKDINNGWFVGIVDKGAEVYYFALNVEPKDQNDVSKFLTGREEATRETLRLLKII